MESPHFNSGALPKNESVENLSEWRRLKVEAPTRAKELVSSIRGYDEMSLGGKIRALDVLFSDLEPKNNQDQDTEKKNKNRFIGRYVSLLREELAIEEMYQSKKERIEFALAA